MTTINERLNELVELAPRVEINGVVLQLLKNGTLFYGDVRRSAHSANRILDIIDELSVGRAYQEGAKGYAAGKKTATTQLWTSVQAAIRDRFYGNSSQNLVLEVLKPLFANRATDNSIPPEQPRKADLVEQVAKLALENEKLVTALQTAQGRELVLIHQRDELQVRVQLAFGRERDANQTITELREKLAQTDHESARWRSNHDVLERRVRETSDQLRVAMQSVHERDAAVRDAMRLFTENAQLRTELHASDAAVRRQEHITADEIRKHGAVTKAAHLLVNAWSRMATIEAMQALRKSLTEALQ